MEEIIEHIENLIDDLERDGYVTREETLNSLKKIKEKAEDIHLSLDY